MHSVSRFRVRLARFDAHSKRGTESSNPPPATGESANFRFLASIICAELMVVSKDPLATYYSCLTLSFD